ncbi:MAG: Dabb family protein [Pseudomonadota bacterium]
MIKHIVMLDLPDDYDREELADIMKDLDGLRSSILGFRRLEHGPNKDFEGMSQNCAYAFICHFADEETSRRYIVDPGHNALGQRLVNMCKGGVKGITVVDMDLTLPTRIAAE